MDSETDWTPTRAAGSTPKKHLGAQIMLNKFIPVFFTALNACKLKFKIIQLMLNSEWTTGSNPTDKNNIA